MKEALEQIRQQADQLIAAADSEKAVDELRVRFLGKKGELTGILKQMGKLSAEERPVVGALANQVREEIDARIQQRHRQPLPKNGCVHIAQRAVRHRDCGQQRVHAFSYQRFEKNLRSCHPFLHSQSSLIILTAPLSALLTMEAYAFRLRETFLSRSWGVNARTPLSFSSARRAASSSSDTLSEMLRDGMSMSMMSPSRTSAIVPPDAASGETCPMLSPEVPPLNLPSVSRAQLLPRCMDFKYEVG